MTLGQYGVAVGKRALENRHGMLQQLLGVAISPVDREGPREAALAHCHGGVFGSVGLFQDIEGALDL